MNIDTYTHTNQRKQKNLYSIYKLMNNFFRNGNNKNKELYLLYSIQCKYSKIFSKQN